MPDKRLWADVTALLEALKGAQTLTASVAMELLAMYMDTGPFTFEPMQLRDRMNARHPGLRVNTLGLVGLQEELERLFVVENGLWRPRPDLFREE